MKRIAGILSILLCCLLLISCQQNNSESKTSSDPSWNEVWQKKRLIVGVYTDQDPFAFSKTGIYQGFDIEMMRELSKRLNVLLEFRTLKKYDEINWEEIDCICSAYAYTMQRNEQMTLSAPYVSVRQVLVVKSKSKVKNFADLKGKNLGILRGGSVYRALLHSEIFKEELKNTKFFETEAEIFEELLNDNLDAAIVSEALVRNRILQGEEIRVLLDPSNQPDVISSDDYVIAFKRGNDSLMNKIEETLLTMKRDGILDQLFERWFSDFLSYDEHAAAQNLNK